MVSTASPNRLNIYIRNVALNALCLLVIYSLPALGAEEEWHKTVIKYESLGADVNNYLRLVGLPKDHICQFMSSQPAYRERSHDFIYVSGHPSIKIEIEYSKSGQTIQRFRFIEKTKEGYDENKFGGWQIKNVREHPGDFTTSISICELSSQKDNFEIPFATMPFTPERWKTDPQHRGWFLFDIVHDHPVIGMTQPEIIKILGRSDYSPVELADKNYDFDLVDRYVLSQGCTGVYSYLEIGYKDDKVAAYRVGPPESRRRRFR